MKRKVLITLLCAALLTSVLPAAWPSSAKADGSAPWGLEFAYQKGVNTRLTFVSGNSSFWLSELLSAFGLSGTVTSVGGSVGGNVWAIYDVMDFTNDAQKDDWLVTPPSSFRTAPTAR